MTKHRLNLRKVAMIACLAAFFANNVLAQEYNVGDITVINNIIANNGLNWTPANPADGSYIPADWDDEEYCVWTSDLSNKRITELKLNWQDLTDTLDVSGLVNLQYLGCAGNQLTALNVSGIVNLQGIDCGGNQLTALDVSGFVNLRVLYCAENQLTALNVSELQSLQNLNCGYNQLTMLDVSGLPLSWGFDASNQSVSLTMASNGTNYTAAIVLNTPANLSAGLMYFGGTLTSASNTIPSSLFEVQTGLAGKTLSGTFNFTYLELYNVTFAGVEISIPSQPILEGGKVSKPTDPERDNYDFGGWFTDNGTFLNEWNFATYVVTQDTTLYAKWTETTGISEIESASVKIYPIPVKDELKIESGDLTIKKVEILDITGKSVGNSSNVSALSSGIYFVRIETDKGIITEKFVKE